MPKIEEYKSKTGLVKTPFKMPKIMFLANFKIFGGWVQAEKSNKVFYKIEINLYNETGRKVDWS